MSDRTNTEWVETLRGAHAEIAISDLRALLLRSLRYGLTGRGVTEADLEDFAQDALLKVLAELGSFRGEARFLPHLRETAPLFYSVNTFTGMILFRGYMPKRTRTMPQKQQNIRLFG